MPAQIEARSETTGKRSFLMDAKVWKTVRVEAYSEEEAQRLGRQAIIDELGQECTIEGDLDIVEDEPVEAAP